MNDSQKLKKHVHVIHSYSKFSLVQRKLVNALLYNAYSELATKTRFSIKTKDLCLLMGYHSRDICKLRLALEGLMSTIIRWNIIDGNNVDKDDLTSSGMLASQNIKNGICTYSYSDHLKELLYKPDIYAYVDMDIMKRFKSSYGLALYENCIRFQKIKQTSWFSLKTFRHLMGVDDNKYRAFKDFKKRVLNVAVNEVNNIAPIYIIPELNKETEEIRFLLSKENKEPSKLDLDDNVTELFHVLNKTFGISDRVVNDFIAKYGETYIREKITLVTNSSSYKAGGIKNLSGYLVNALECDYQQPKSSKLVVRKIEKNKEEEKLKKSKKEKLIGDKYSEYLSKHYESVKNSLTDNVYNDLKNEYINEVVKSEILMKVYKKEGFEHPMIKGGFREYIEKKFPEKFAHVLDMSRFKELFN